MLTYLILLFVAVPLAELALLIWVDGQVGLAATLTLVILTGILGASLARWQGLATLTRFQSRLAAGEVPHEDLIDGILILMAGAVLLTPGLITDSVGFLLLVPAVRGKVRRWLVARFSRRLASVAASARVGRGSDQGWPPEAPRGDVVDAEFEVKDLR